MAWATFAVIVARSTCSGGRFAASSQIQRTRSLPGLSRATSMDARAGSTPTTSIPRSARRRANTPSRSRCPALGVPRTRAPSEGMDRDRCGQVRAGHRSRRAVDARSSRQPCGRRYAEIAPNSYWVSLALEGESGRQVRFTVPVELVCSDVARYRGPGQGGVVLVDEAIPDLLDGEPLFDQGVAELFEGIGRGHARLRMTPWVCGCGAARARRTARRETVCRLARVRTVSFTRVRHPSRRALLPTQARHGARSRLLRPHTPWNSGIVESHVIRIKMIKRQMYGRAGFRLLRKRVLLLAGRHSGFTAVEPEPRLVIQPPLPGPGTGRANFEVKAVDPGARSLG